MRNPLPKRALALIAVAAFCTPAAGEEYMCENADGCDAVAPGPDGPVVVTFREGDIVDSDRGWVVATGWTVLD